MNKSMEKQSNKAAEARMAEIPKDKERIIHAIKNSPYLKQKNEEAARQLSQLKPPFPWEKDATRDKS